MKAIRIEIKQQTKALPESLITIFTFLKKLKREKKMSKDEAKETIIDDYVPKKLIKKAYEKIKNEENN